VNLKPRRNEEPEVNLTPLIDVVFLMLIFFMVSTTFLNKADLQITLPEANKEPSQEQPDPMRITINAEGGMFVNQKELVNTKTATVRRALEDALGEQTADQGALVIRADGQVAHGWVVTAMDAARQVGVSSVGIATKPRTE